MADLKPIDLDTLLQQEDEKENVERKPMLRSFIDNYAAPGASYAVSMPMLAYQKLQEMNPGVNKNMKVVSGAFDIKG